MILTESQVLASYGIITPDLVVVAAKVAGLELAAAAALLDMESSGGRNVWGSDPVQTGGCYVKGTAVTPAAYRAYRSRRAEIGAQGVGPCQLTYPGLQDAADAVGGCWLVEANLRVGFTHLAALVQNHGDHDGFAAYNGSGPAAEAYAAKAMGLLTTWRSRLAATEEDNMPLTDADAQKVAAAVLAALIPDYAKDPTGKTPIALGVSEAWEATHVGQIMARLDAIGKKLGT